MDEEFLLSDYTYVGILKLGLRALAAWHSGHRLRLSEQGDHGFDSRQSVRYLSRLQCCRYIHNLHFYCQNIIGIVTMCI
jgi:hypothetical protein